MSEVSRTIEVPCPACRSPQLVSASSGTDTCGTCYEMFQWHAPPGAKVPVVERVRFTEPCKEAGPAFRGKCPHCSAVIESPGKYVAVNCPKCDRSVTPIPETIAEREVRRNGEIASAAAAADGRKDDAGKLDWTLMPWAGLSEILRVLEFGAKKYDRDNWRKVPDAKRRYMSAALRHLIAHARGEALDPESGLSHLAHAGCCILFLLEVE